MNAAVVDDLTDFRWKFAWRMKHWPVLLLSAEYCAREAWEYNIVRSSHHSVPVLYKIWHMKWRLVPSGASKLQIMRHAPLRLIQWQEILAASLARTVFFTAFSRWNCICSHRHKFLAAPTFHFMKRIFFVSCINKWPCLMITPFFGGNSGSPSVALVSGFIKSAGWQYTNSHRCTWYSFIDDLPLLEHDFWRRITVG